VWAHIYDDTVRLAGDGASPVEYRTSALTAPKIEPEIVFKLKQPIPPGGDAAAALACVEWLALGFEIIDCVYPDWKFQAPDFIAAYGLHAGLVVGPPRGVAGNGGEGLDVAGLLEALPRFTVKLLRNGEVVAEGSGKNSLRSPAACLAELATAVAARGDSDSLAAGALVSSGTLTESQPMIAGETWTATVDGLDLSPISLRVG
jgi:2-oxo-3-hexenedioate decarboxylase